MHKTDCNIETKISMGTDSIRMLSWQNLTKQNHTRREHWLNKYCSWTWHKRGSKPYSAFKPAITFKL